MQASSLASAEEAEASLHQVSQEAAGLRKQVAMLQVGLFVLICISFMPASDRAPDGVVLVCLLFHACKWMCVVIPQCVSALRLQGL